MEYSNTLCAVAILIFAMITMYDSRELTKDQIAILKDAINDWDDAPKVEKICEGDVVRKKNITTFNFKYDSPDGGYCNATYQIKVSKKNGRSQKHKFDCVMVPKEDPKSEEDFD